MACIGISLRSVVMSTGSRVFLSVAVENFLPPPHAGPLEILRCLVSFSKQSKHLSARSLIPKTQKFMCLVCLVFFCLFFYISTAWMQSQSSQKLSSIAVSLICSSYIHTQNSVLTPKSQISEICQCPAVVSIQRRLISSPDRRRSLAKIQYDTFKDNRDVDTSLRIMKKQFNSVARPLCPDLSRDHGLLRSDWGHEVLLGQEVQRELDQEASDFAQLLLSAGQISLGQTWFGLVLLQLGHVPHQGRRKTSKHLQPKTHRNWLISQQK